VTKAGAATGAGSADMAEEPTTPARRGGLLRWVKVGFGVLVVVFGVLFVVTHWAEVSRSLAEMGWLPVLAAVPLGAAGTIAGMLTWRAVLADLGAPLALRDAGRVFFLSQLGKYVPGSVWPVLAQMELGHQLRVPRKSSLAANALTMVMSVATGLLLAALLLPFGGADTLRRYWWVLLAVPLFAAFLHPAVATGVLNRLLTLIRRQPLEVSTTIRGTVRAAGWQTLGWLLLGIHAYVLVLGLHVPAGRAFPLAVGGFTLAYCLGIIFILAPAGAGVRDAALAVALASVLDRPQALAVVLVSRFAMVAVDFLLASGWLLAVRKPTLRTEP
jgi:glycosyltransferase 2 family protein